MKSTKAKIKQAQGARGKGQVSNASLAPRRLPLAPACLCLLILISTARAADPLPYLLHLPGIGGHMRIDDNVTDGLQFGGIKARVEIYDWTRGQPGMIALTHYDDNQLEAQKVADKLTAAFRADPKRKIILTSHSGGGGIAIFALEKLPDDVKIDTLLMLAPALSPDYDLSKALRHVTGKAYVFTSTLDWIDGWGTRNFGTMDRVKSDSAGNVGFRTPEKPVDEKQYDKLVSFPYDPAWTRFGNAGEHIGTMSFSFARNILAPLLLTGKLPHVAPASQPATRAAE